MKTFQPAVMHLAAVNLKMSLAEALVASMFNSAHSIGPVLFFNSAHKTYHSETLKQAFWISNDSEMFKIHNEF